jgi:hypothetical protein
MCRRMIYLISLVVVLSMAGGASADLVAHWSFDEGSGTVAHDASGNGHDGSFEGSPQWTSPGWNGIGWCLQFGGDNDRLTVESFDLTGSGITLAAWINVTTFQDDARLISKSEGSGTPDHYWAMILSGNGENNLEFRLRTDTGGTSRYSAPDTHDLQTDEWTHIALTWDASDQFMRFYKNGEEIFSQSKAGGAVGTNPDVKIAIGNQSASVADAAGRIRPFGGLIDNVVVYDRALDKEELEAVMSGLKGIPYARKPDPANGSMLTSTWVNLTWVPGQRAVSHDVYIGTDFDDVDEGAEGMFVGNTANDFIVVGFPGFPYPDGLVPGTTYYWRIDEVNDSEPNSPWKGEVWSFSIPPKTAYAPEPANGAESVDPTVELSWTAGFGSKLHTVYFGDNFDDVNNATDGLAQGKTTYSPGPLELSKTYYWRIDEFDIIETYNGEVWSFTTQGAVKSLDPLSGAVDVKQTPILTWLPSVYAASHEIYFGADKDAVKNADTGSPEYKGTRALGSETYDPGKLEWDSTYYWRIDEVNNTNPDSPWIGPLWSFTTANFLIVDDFESYNDIDPPDPQSNRIFEAWLDGYEIPTNGALVGNDLPPYTEQTIVHSGNQSMPLFYDNSVGYSEAALTLTYPRDWTENGVSKLTIWFRGDSDNAAENLYVALNGSAVVNHDNTNATQINRWTEWNIDLQAFADQGVNLANVNTISLGLGNRNNPVAGGSGTMYFDDIRLYPPPREPAP